MTSRIGGLFTAADRVQFQSLDHRLKRSNVINSNIANAETPGFRAIGYEFEEQLQEASGSDNKLKMNVSDPRHLLSSHVKADGTIKPDVFVRPTESVGEDGNTVDIDAEMAKMAENQILYRAAVETINRKVGMLRYAINGGR